MTRTSTRKIGAGVVAAGAAVTLAWTGLAPASAGSSPQVRSWHDALQGSGAAVTSADATAGADANITGAQRLVFRATTERGRGVDTGAKGDSPGDYFVFEDRLTNPSDARIGSDSGRCMLIVRTFRCDATFFLDGRGSLEVSGSFKRDSTLIAVTGGTGDFRNVRGQARVVDETPKTVDFVVTLLP